MIMLEINVQPRNLSESRLHHFNSVVEVNTKND
jgi:hypothetical protein